jgi:hypothetical protein
MTLTVTLTEPVYRVLEQRAAAQQRSLIELASELLTESAADESDESQAWYWTERWQTGARTAEKDLREGSYKDFATMNEFIAALAEPLADEADAAEGEMVERVAT